MPLKPRGIILVGGLILLAIIVVALVASSGTRPQTGVFPGKVYTATINADVGLQSIKYTNQNTPSSCIIMATEMPFSFNFTSGDTLTFNVTAREGFKFNTWFTNDGFNHNQNPYTVKATGPFSMRADFIPLTEEMP